MEEKILEYDGYSDPMIEVAGRRYELVLMSNSAEYLRKEYPLYFPACSIVLCKKAPANKRYGQYRQLFIWRD
jgi:hypothetical protein